MDAVPLVFAVAGVALVLRWLHFFRGGKLDAYTEISPIITEMKNTAYAKYYEKNRDTLTEKMREREANRRAERKKEYETNPDALEEDRKHYRKKYATNRANRVKALLESYRPHPVAEALLESGAYATLTPRAVQKLLPFAPTNNADSRGLIPTSS